MEADQGDDYTHLMVSQLPLHVKGLDNFQIAHQWLLKENINAQLILYRFTQIEKSFIDVFSVGVYVLSIPSRLVWEELG